MRCRVIATLVNEEENPKTGNPKVGKSKNGKSIGKTLQRVEVKTEETESGKSKRIKLEHTTFVSMTSVNCGVIATN